MSWIDDRRKGVTSTFGSVKVKGGMLPKSATINGIKVNYDENMPHFTGTRGGNSIYESTGNIQVFFNKRGEERNIEWVGNIVDIYYIH